MLRPRIKRRVRGPLPFKYVLFITFIFFVLSAALGLWIINKSLKPTLMSFAESQTRQIATLAISKAGMEREPVDIHEVIVKDKESDLIYFDTEKINKIRGDTARLILKNIKMAEKGELEELEDILEMDMNKNDKGKGIVYSIPLGKVTNNALLGNLGPHIPVQFSTVGHLQADVETEFQEVGINNVYVEIFINLTVHMQIIIPFASEKAEVKQKIPVAVGILPGEVPQFYNKGGGGLVPSLQIPVD